MDHEPSRISQLAKQLQAAITAIRAYEITFNKAEQAYLSRLTGDDNTPADQLYALKRRALDALFMDAARIRSELFALKPETLFDIGTILTVIRSEEEDVFLDSELARIFDSLIAGLHDVAQTG